jgi:hypothetical protein
MHQRGEEKGGRRREGGGRERGEGNASPGALRGRNRSRDITKLQNPKNKVEKTLVGVEGEEFLIPGNRDHSHLAGTPGCRSMHVEGRQ